MKEKEADVIFLNLDIDQDLEIQIFHKNEKKGYEYIQKGNIPDYERKINISERFIEILDWNGIMFEKKLRKDLYKNIIIEE